MWRFYVYRLFDKDGITKYIGKGSGFRLNNQKRKFSLCGEAIAFFRKEEDAYGFESEQILTFRPELNKHPGGNGNRSKLRVPRKYAWEHEIEHIGPRRYAARFLLRYPYLFDRDKLDIIRRVADGSWC